MLREIIRDPKIVKQEVAELKRKLATIERMTAIAGTHAWPDFQKTLETTLEQVKNTLLKVAADDTAAVAKLQGEGLAYLTIIETATKDDEGIRLAKKLEQLREELKRSEQKFHLQPKPPFVLEGIPAHGGPFNDHGGYTA